MKPKLYLERLIFVSRWVLVPIYLGLILGAVLYTFKFAEELWNIMHHFISMSESEMMVELLALIDISMIGNLLIMIIIGGYSIFVHEMKFENAHDKPQWLNHINSGTLKVKMGMSLIGVSSIHLLKIFIESEGPNSIFIKCSIHVIFITSTLLLAFTDRLLHPPEEEKHEASNKTLGDVVAANELSAPSPKAHESEGISHNC